MAPGQHPKTMKLEIMKSNKTALFLNAHFEIHKQFSVFCPFSIMQKRLAITRNWLSQNRGKHKIHSQNEGALHA